MLAKAVGQATLMSQVMASSLASQLLQGGMRQRHGFNEFLSIVSCFARPQDEAVGAALAL
ncbi:hypothetical protein V0M98_25785 [Pseudomonas silesiensis]|uniref:hypothetical protein n=1 Tax=Pseudomonas silesiensis TaxID=1853130 RepID=UPI0030CD2FBE